MLPQLIDAAFKLFTGIISGLLQATPQIIGALLGLIPKMVDALMQAVPRLIQAGFDVISGFVKGLLENGPRLVAEAAASIANSLINGVKGLLGIKSPSKVFYDFGVNVGEGFINGMRVMFNGVEATAEQLAALVADPTRKTLKALGIETTYTNYGVPNVVRTTSGAMFDVGRATDDLNAIFEHMGARTAEQMAEVENAIFGGSFQSALDVLFGQTSLMNPFTGQRRTIGGTPEGIQAVMDSMEDAFYFDVVEPLNKSTEELIEVFENLSKSVMENGFVPAGVFPPSGMAGGGGGGPAFTAMATGGYVDSPTHALIGEAGPEVVMPLDRFESLMGLTEQSGKTLNYYAAPNQSVDSEAELFKAMRRAKVVANW
jgi:flagellar biosynthesis protein FliQ